MAFLESHATANVTIIAMAENDEHIK